MRNLLSFVCLAVVVLMVVVDARSPVKCPSTCNAEGCEAVNCECGTYKDECQCCDHCRTCADATCSLLHGDVCVDGYTCAHPVGTTFLQRMNGEGMCVAENRVTDGMYAP